MGPHDPTLYQMFENCPKLSKTVPNDPKIVLSDTMRSKMNQNGLKWSKTIQTVGKGSEMHQNGHKESIMILNYIKSPNWYLMLANIFRSGTNEHRNTLYILGISVQCISNF